MIALACAIGFVRFDVGGLLELDTAVVVALFRIIVEKAMKEPLEVTRLEDRFDAVLESGKMMGGLLEILLEVEEGMGRELEGLLEILLEVEEGMERELEKLLEVEEGTGRELERLLEVGEGMGRELEELTKIEEVLGVLLEDPLRLEEGTHSEYDVVDEVLTFGKGLAGSG